MKCPFVIKICTKCKRILVANETNFRKRKRGKYNLDNNCKCCRREIERRSYSLDKKIKNKGNPFDDMDIDKVWNHCPFCIKVCIKCNKILVANDINFPKREGGIYGLRNDCRVCKCDFNKNNYQENREERLEKQITYGVLHKEERKKYNKKYRKDNPDKVFNNYNKRRLRENNQGEGITKEQWYEMMEFFNWECAYSGIQLNKDNRSIDHIIPLKKNGKHEIWNLVPMYINYNSQKSTKDMFKWYLQQSFFSEDRLNRIYEWVNYAYNKWGGVIK